MSEAGGANRFQRAEAYVDEAGAKGLLRNLDESTDDQIALIASLVIPFEDRDRFRSGFDAPFASFKAARPSQVGSLHITDAFGSGDPSWAAAAQAARNDIFLSIRGLTIPIVYDARRLRLARTSHQRVQSILDEAHAQRRSNVAIPRHPNAERVEEECMIGLALKLDAMASDCRVGVIDLMTDQLDRPIAKIFREMMDRVRTVGDPKEHVTSGWDRDAGKKVYGMIRTSITDTAGNSLDWLGAKHLGDLVVLGKDDALVFAADVVVNALHHHLRSLPSDAPLNHPSSVAGWTLGDRVYGVRDDALEDKI